MSPKSVSLEYVIKSKPLIFFHLNPRLLITNNSPILDPLTKLYHFQNRQNL